MEIGRCIKGRRSVREYQKKEVPFSKIADILNAARYAPSSGNVQNWRFIVIKELKKELAKICHQKFIGSCSYVIAVCSRTEQVERLYGERGKRLYSIQNTAACAQNIMLKAYELGLGTCWVGAFDDLKVKSLLKIPDDVDIHALIAVGYVTSKEKMPGREPLDALTYFEKWGNKESEEKKTFPIEKFFKNLK